MSAMEGLMSSFEYANSAVHSTHDTNGYPMSSTLADGGTMAGTKWHNNSIALPATLVESPPIATPLPVTPNNGLVVTDFNNLCLQHGFAPDFVFTEVEPRRFCVDVRFGSHFIHGDSSWSSKKGAKEAVCQQALAVLKQIDTPDRNRNRESSKQALSELHEEDWVAILNNWTQKHGIAIPAYQYYEADTQSLLRKGLSQSEKGFACTVRVECIPLEVCKSDQLIFTTKADAKRHAAKDAVEWLGANGHLDIVRLRKHHQFVAGNVSRTESAGNAELTHAVEKIKIEESFAQRLDKSATHLGFRPPEYEIHPVPSPPGSSTRSGFVKVSAVFLHRDASLEPRLRGKLGEVGPILGKKAAKEECCKAVLPILEQIASERGLA